jgi:hypothetical protein
MKLNLPDGTCLQCGGPFKRIATRDMERKRFCSRRCGILHQHASGAMTKHKKIGPEGVHWRGGRFLRGGYVWVWTGPRTYKAEHRVVMEQKLGRPLRPVEHVHHLNGVRNDNRPENLELWEKPHPNGVRHFQKKHCPTCTCFD